MHEIDEIEAVAQAILREAASPDRQTEKIVTSDLVGNGE